MLCNLWHGVTGAILCLALVAPVSAATVTIRWNPNPEPDVTNYNVYVRTQFSTYGPPVAVGNRTSWTFVNLQDNVQVFFAVEAQNNQGVSPRAEIGFYTPVTNLPGSEASRSDYNGDGWFDILWQHRTGGDLGVWHLNATRVALPRSLSTPQVPPEWRLSGSGDFNRDGNADLVWHNQQNGQVAYWLMNGIFNWTTGYFPGPVPTEWQIASVRDFDLDGNPDIWWHNKVTGEMAVWYLDGVSLVRTGAPSPARIPDMNWTLAGTADFTGDGRPDALWHNDATGELAIWKLFDISLVAALPLNPHHVATGWKIVALGDADLDGKADIVWQDDVSGGLALWKMNGTTLMSGDFLSIPTAHLNWKIMGPK